MGSTTRRHTWRSALVAFLTAMACVLGAGAVGLPAAHAKDPTVTLVGDFQKVLGCAKDWQPDCTATHMDAPTAASTSWTKTVKVPAGKHEFKVALNDSWDVSYGADGKQGGDNVPLVLAGASTLTFQWNPEDHRLAVVPTDIPGDATAADKELAHDSLRAPNTRERFYFVMADRFANGDPGNDRGGLTGTRLQTGSDPSDKGFYHGGDLKGVIDHLDYVKGLGTTAIWLTPSFANKPVQGTGKDASAGYHGYWVTDFTRIDPHLGTNADMRNLIKAAHQRGMKVYFDIIVNHTADVISYKEGKYGYVPKSEVPYKDAQGKVFDDAEVADTDAFPEMSVSSFPYTPVIADAEKDVKVPAWLNDPTLYHNRGDSTYEGESATYGDFSGLDDLFTENPRVLSGMEDIYRTWMDFGVDGYRIDTVKHVNTAFWEKFSPAMMEHAAATGRKNFTMFGEVYSADPQVESTYTTTGGLPSVLDFGFQAAALAAAKGGPTTGLRDFFASDDWFTDTDSNAYQNPTFLGNHDMGRVAMMLAKSGHSGEDLVKRVQLADDLMYLVRGNPVTYYGDEQGFTGNGGDKDAREDMFATKVDQYASEKLVDGSTMGSSDHYSTSSPLYRHIAELSRVRAANPALADGSQIHRYASSRPGIYAFSRLDRSTGIEYVVAVNTATTTSRATFSTYTAGNTFSPVYGTTTSLTSNQDSRVTVSVPALSASVWRAAKPIPSASSAPAIHITSPSAGSVQSGRASVSAALADDSYAQVSFWYRPVGTQTWKELGTDDNPDYSVRHDVSGMADGTLLEYRAVAKDLAGHVSAASSYGVVGRATSSGGTVTPVGPVDQPKAVSVPGSHNSEMGCAGDWEPACQQAQMSLDPTDQIWKLSADIPAGSYEYKAAINKSWDENYGAGGAANGNNIPLTSPGRVTFYYDHARHYVTSDAEGPIVTAPGSFQKALGCGKDWSPSCMRPWLTDPDGDGVYTWSTDLIPAGNYEWKVTMDLSWDKNYGADGKEGGDNMTFSVPSDGTVVTFSYDSRSHVGTVRTSQAGVAADLARAKAYWVGPTTLAWPAAAVPKGMKATDMTWRLHWSPSAGLAVDSEAVTADDMQEATLRLDPKGLPTDVLSSHPELKGYLALTLSGDLDRDRIHAMLSSQLAVGQYDHSGRLVDATGVQTPIILDHQYAAAAQKLTYGVSFSGDSQTFRLWAPTALSVDLLTWPAGAETSGKPTVRRMTYDPASGSWALTGKGLRNVRYLYRIKVVSPADKKIVTSDVTDPYSVGLTLDSTASVAVDLSDETLMPRQWRDTASPRLDKPVDSTIYELHVRDFSSNDRTVPAAHRGSYLAFADDGEGTKHLRELAASGLNTVHLLPTFDIATIPESRRNQHTPPCDLASYPPNSAEQQACVAKIADTDGFNWGYDPWHWLTPEGSYASSDAAADGGRRVAEFRTMVGGLHADGLRVVLDQVYNHTSTSGLDPKSVLDKVVPGYYHRLDATGKVQTSTCCSNVATEHSMAQKIMVDSVVSWARNYRVDGFRFDLMGHASVENMKAVRAALDKLTLAKDGVDGHSVYLYGEGWNFGEVADNALFTQATQGQLDGTGIGAFNDRLRDAVRGGTPFDENPHKQGFGSGEATDPNGDPINDKAASTLGHDTDLVQLGLAGNLKSFTFVNSARRKVSGKDVDYNGSPAGFASRPSENVNYVDAHDNETLWDSLTYKLPAATSMDDRIRMNTLSLATTALSQSPSFWHAGADLLRSKSLDRNSYNSGDWFNTLDWTGADNGFGHGLPPKVDNEAKYPVMKDLLARKDLKPTAVQVRAASDQAEEMLRLRFSSPLFRLGSADLINQKVSFPVSGTAASHPGVIVMRIDDTVGTDVDPSVRNLVVVINASAKAVDQKVPSLAGHQLALSQVQADGVDKVVRSTRWTASSGTVRVPARTVAVLVEGEQGGQPTPAPSTVLSPSAPATNPHRATALPKTGW